MLWASLGVVSKQLNLNQGCDPNVIHRVHINRLRFIMLIPLPNDANDISQWLFIYWLEKAISHQDNNPEVSLFYSLHFWSQVADFDLPRTICLLQSYFRSSF